MRFDDGTKTRLFADVEMDIDPTGSTVEVRVDDTWYAASWLDSPVASGGRWTQTARTSQYFAGPAVSSPGTAVVLESGRHLTETRVTVGGDILTFDSSPVDVS